MVSESVTTLACRYWGYRWWQLWRYVAGVRAAPGGHSRFWADTGGAAGNRLFASKLDPVRASTIQLLLQANSAPARDHARAHDLPIYEIRVIRWGSCCARRARQAGML